MRIFLAFHSLTHSFLYFTVTLYYSSFYTFYSSNKMKVHCRAMAMRALGLLGVMMVLAEGTDLGLNWGTDSSHPLPPLIVVKTLKESRLKRVRVLDTQPHVMQALSSSNIHAFIAIPNVMLPSLGKSKPKAHSWVHENVTRYSSKGGGNIRYIGIGNDPFHRSHKGIFQKFVLPAATNIQNALDEVGIGTQIKVVVPCSVDIFHNMTRLPSKATIRPDLNKTMHQLLPFLNKKGSPFVMNLSPFMDFHGKNNLSLDFMFLRNSSHPVKDGKNVYSDDLDWNIDMFESALRKIGYSQMPVIVGEIGWPTDGGVNASSVNARRFLRGLSDKIKDYKGTPLRPGNPPSEIYIMSLLDEDERNITNGDFERHWGIFTFDGQAKFQVDLGQGSEKKLVNAQNVRYLTPRWCVANDNLDLSNVSIHAQLACSTADCTALHNGGSCNHLRLPANASYAFNSYYQLHNQSIDSCNFGGLGLITFQDPSDDDCRFLVAIHDSFASSLYNINLQFLFAQFLLLAFCHFLLAEFHVDL